MIRRLLSLCAIAFGGSLCMMAQTISVEKPIVSYPSEDKYKAVEASNLLHAVEGSSAVYKILVEGFDSIENVISCKYIDYTSEHDIISNCSLEKGVLQIEDITLTNLKASNEIQDFRIELIAKEKGKNANTECSAEAMGIKVYSIPKQNVEPPSYLVFCEKTGELVWSANGDGGSKWEYSWTSTEGPEANSENYEHPSIDNKGTSEKDVTVTLIATNYAPDGTTIWDTYTESWIIKVWPKPTTKLNIDPKTEDHPEKKFQGDSWDLAVSTAGGNMEGWKIEWRDADDGNKLLGQGEDYKLISTATNKIYTRHIRLIVSNNAPEGAQESSWLYEPYDYFIRFYPVPNVQFTESYPENVMDGYETTMSVKLAEDTEQKEEYVIKYNWGGNYYSETYPYKASNRNNNDGIPDNIIVKCSFGLSDSDAKTDFNKELSHTFTVWPIPEVTKVNSNTPDSPTLRFQDGTWDLSVSTTGGYKSGWEYVWKDEGGRELSRNKTYTMRCDKTSDEVEEKHIILTVTNKPNEGDDLWLNKTYDFYAKFHPAPIINFEEYPKNIKHGDKIEFSLKVVDAKGNSQDASYDLDYSWNNGKSKDELYEYIGDNPSNNNGTSVSIKVSGNITLIGTNLVQQYSREANIVVWPVPKTDNTNITDRVGYSGQLMEFSVIPIGGKKDGWTYEWTKDNQSLDVSTGTLELTLDDVAIDSKTNKYSVKVVNTCDGVTWFNETDSFNVTIYPRPMIPNDVVFVDKNRSNAEVITGIREGNELILHCDDCSGGYPNGWSYKWMRNDEELCAQNVYNETVHSGYTGYGKANDLLIKYSCYVENLYNTIPWMQQNYSREIRVYRKPQTPTGLQRKGNGTSGTWIATCGIDDSSLDSNDYYLVFGYRDANGNMHDVSTMSQQNVGEQRWSTSMTSSGYADGRNNAYVYALWKYDDGAEITSGLRFESHVDEKWDGSTYNGTTRSVIADVTGISTVSSNPAGANSREYYTINGQKTNQMQKGLNIIRREDGQFVKYYNK